MLDNIHALCAERDQLKATPGYNKGRVPLLDDALKIINARFADKRTIQLLSVIEPDKRDRGLVPSA